MVANDAEETHTENSKSLKTKKKVKNLTVIPDEISNDEVSSDIKTPTTPITPTAKSRTDITSTGEKKSLQRLKSKQGRIHPPSSYSVIHNLGNVGIFLLLQFDNYYY